MEIVRILSTFFLIICTHALDMDLSKYLVDKNGNYKPCYIKKDIKERRYAYLFWKLYVLDMFIHIVNTMLKINACQLRKQ